MGCDAPSPNHLVHLWFCLPERRNCDRFERRSKLLVVAVKTSILQQDLGMIRYIALFVCLILDVINIYWFSKIFNGAKKLFFGPASRPETAVANGGEKTDGKKISIAAKYNELSRKNSSSNPTQSRRRVEKEFG